MAISIHANPPLQVRSQSKPKVKSKRISPRERRIIQHRLEVTDPPLTEHSHKRRLNNTFSPQQYIIEEGEEEDDPFYYYDLTSSSDTDEAKTQTLHKPQQEDIQSRKLAFISTIEREEDEEERMPEVKEWQWVCCCCGKYNALTAYYTTTTGREQCAGKMMVAGRGGGKEGLCGHKICSGCQDVETTVWRGERKERAERKGKR